MDRSLRLLSALSNTAFWAFGLVLNVYLAMAAFGFVRNSSEHYSNFILAVLGMAGFLAIKSYADRRLNEPKLHGGARYWLGLAVALVATTAAIWSAGYLRYHAVRLEAAQPFFEAYDFNVGVVLIASILVLNWIHWGWLLTTIIAASIGYFFYGYLVPVPLLATPYYDPEFVMNYLGLGTNDGIFWFAREAADSIWFLIMFAGALFAVGTLKMVLELGKAAGNHITGGAAFPAIIGSAIVGAIMGTAVSNVVLTGRFTIPMMKQKGYSASMAGAIEATASTAGQILPPVLGLAAFIIAALLNMPYIDIALAAVVPGLLYLSGVTMGILVYAQRNRLPRLGESVDRGLILRLMPTFLISFSIVMYMLLSYYTPSYAGLIGMLAAIVLGLFQGRLRPKLKDFVISFRSAIEMAAILSLLLVAIGPLGQAFLTTNLSGRLGTVLILYLPDSTLMLLVGAAVLALILGMGLPTPVAYVIVALALVPFLQQLGVEPLLAHFFVFYFACFSALSPPVAVAALAAAKVSGASFFDTALDSVKLMLTTFVIPFAFVYYPSLMGFPNLEWNILIPIVTCLLLQLAVSVACYGYLWRHLGRIERWGFAAVSFAGYAALTSRTLISNIIFGVMLLGMAAYVFITRYRDDAASAERPAVNKSPS